MTTHCPHCQVKIEIDPSTLAAFAGRSHFNCPACQGAVALPGRSRNLASAQRGTNRNLLVLGIVALLVLGGIGFILASKKSGDTNTTVLNIRNEIINNTYFQNLIATGTTTKQDLEAIEEIRPYQDEFIGLSAAKLDWKDAEDLAKRTGAVVVDAGSDDELISWLVKTFTLSSTSSAWIRSRGNAGLLTSEGAFALKDADGVRKVLLHWSPSTTTPSGFALIPAGDFTMGQDGIVVQNGIATPAHTVYVSEFYMAKHETTKELWDEVRAWGLNHGYTDLAVGNGAYASKGANHPVHSITWYDTVKWCNARSDKENLVPCYTVGGLTYKTGQQNAIVCNFAASGYRLPTEAEWEKAARGGVNGKLFSWGTDTITHDQANYLSTTSYAYDVSRTRGYHPSYTAGGEPYTAPVDSFAPNGYGIFNMSGNVWEWCWDWKEDYPSTKQINPQGAVSGSIRVGHGGGWGSDALCAHSAFRGHSEPTAAGHGGGFRLARSHR